MPWCGMRLLRRWAQLQMHAAKPFCRCAHPPWHTWYSEKACKLISLWALSSTLYVMLHKQEAGGVVQEYCSDAEPIVAQSCIVALDMLAYEVSGDFQYADVGSTAG